MSVAQTWIKFELTNPSLIDINYIVTQKMLLCK